MFANNDYYDLDSAQQRIADKKLLLDVYIRNRTIVELLKQKGIIGDLDVQACEGYVRQLPEIKVLTDFMEQAESKIGQYKADPRQHLQDLFAAKMNGSIR